MVLSLIALVAGCATEPATAPTPPKPVVGTPIPKVKEAPTPVEAASTAPGTEASTQSYEEAVETLCGAWTTCPDCPPHDADKAALNLANHIEATVKHPEVIRMFRGWAGRTPEEKGVQFSEALERAGITDCHLRLMFP